MTKVNPESGTDRDGANQALGLALRRDAERPVPLAQVLKELRYATAVFQLRALAAVLGMPAPSSKSEATNP